jgi:pyridoxal phosphate enzyme (YggS family)
LQTAQQRLNKVLASIHDTARRAGRAPDDILLIGASKAQPAAAIRELAVLGVLNFGENFVQEALQKQAALADLDLIWHFIGRIQGNKTREIANHFDWVHSVDRIKIVRRLARQRPADQGPLNICLQVNAQHEPSKAGLSLESLDEVAHIADGLPGIRLRGLMAIPQPADDLIAQRRPFAQLRTALERLNAQGLQLDTLSMGMTADIDAAILEGATMIRIGTALFGPREHKSTGQAGVHRR